MNEFDSHNFVELYKIYSAYQATQTSRNEGEIQVNDTQQSTISTNDSNNEQDLFAVLQAEQQNNQSQHGPPGSKTAPPGDIKQLLSSSTRKSHPFL